MPHITIAAHWPFAVNKLPFFYGWMIVAVSTIGMLCTIPGQTMGMAVFTEPFIRVFGLTRTELSIAYLLGTLASSLLLTRAGRYYDKAGARLTSVLAALGLALCLLLIAAIDLLAGCIAGLASLPVAVISFALISVGYFGVRFTGQGVLTSASRNVLLVWFEKRRGLVAGGRGVFISLGFSIAPVFLAFLINSYGWRQALLMLAALVGLGYVVLALCLLRDAPEDCGLLPDGERHDESKSPPSSIPDSTLRTARADPVFWIYSMVIAFYSLFGTAVIFHIVAIFAEAGRSSEQAFAYFLPYSVVSVITNLTASTLSDHVPLKALLIANLLAFILGAWALTTLHTEAGYWLTMAGLGVTSGLWVTLSNLAYIRFYGRKYLGEISGFGMMLTVLGSAIGPALFSLSVDFSGSYQAGIFFSMAILALLLCAAVIIKQTEPKAVAQAVG